MAGQRRRSGLDVDSRAFEAGLQRKMRELKLTSASDLTRIGLDIQNRARELCPVDTGRLRSSIMSVPGSDRDGAYVDVGTNVEYAAPVEFGTSKQQAQPYLRPAFFEAINAWGRR